MFEVLIVEAERIGMYCYDPYVTHVGKGMSRSPKKAMEAATRSLWKSYAIHGSGVPVFKSVTIKSNGKVISETY